MTPTQRKFRKEINRLEKEGKIPDSYAPRHERSTYRRPISVITIIFLLWNIYAIYTWIAPRFNPEGYYLSETKDVANNVDDFDTRLKHQRIGDYLTLTKSITAHFVLITNRISNHYSGDEKYSIENLHNDLTELNNYRDKLESGYFVGIKLNDLYISNIESLEKALFGLNKSSTEINNIFNEYNTSAQQIMVALIDFLESNEIRYTKNDDGSITYYIIE
jgi:hypothetical protein